MLKDRLKILQELEAYHLSQLSHVRAMISAERGQPLKHEQRNGATESATPFSQLTKAEAAAGIFKQKGDMLVSKLFSSMKRRGHPVKSKNALYNMLSINDRFEKKGKGIWGLSDNERAGIDSGSFKSDLPRRLNG